MCCMELDSIEPVLLCPPGAIAESRHNFVYVLFTHCLRLFRKLSKESIMDNNAYRTYNILTSIELSLSMKGIQAEAGAR